MSKFLDNSSEGWQCARDTLFTRMVTQLQTSKRKYKQAKSLASSDTHQSIAAEKIQEYENIAIRDELTGLYNPHFIANKFVKELKRCKRYKRPFSFMLIAFDHIDNIKREYGENGAENIFKVSATAVMSSLREVDFPARLSNNNFAALLPETDSSSAMIVARRISEKIATVPNPLRLDRSLLSVSIGLVSFPTHGRDENSLLGTALQYLKTAKEQEGEHIVTG